jgi:DNA-3-methyladenine glycosylase II
MRQAATLKARLSEVFGETVSIHGHVLRAFPAPRRLLELDAFSGLFGSKVTNVRAIAGAAWAGRLDGARLRSLPDDLALAELQRLPGIGPFGSQLILLRGAGHPDFLTFEERRFRRAVGIAYGLDRDPTNAELTAISENWRPYRTWVTFLLRQAYEAG